MNGLIFIFAVTFAIVNASTASQSANVSDVLCQPPVLVFYSMSVGSTDIIVSVGGLNQTSPLFGVEGNGDAWSTRWVNVSRGDPEIEFLLQQDQNIYLMKAYFANTPDFVGLRYECPLTKENLTCVVKFALNSDTVELSDANSKLSSHAELVEGVSKMLNIDILKNNSDVLLSRWGPVCRAIANVSDPGHMNVSSQTGDGWTTCSGQTPSPVRFWISVNASGTVSEINSTYTKRNETGWAFLNVSTGGGSSSSCSVDSIVGWSVSASQIDAVHELPILSRLVSDPDSGGSKVGLGGPNYDFFILMMIVVFLILAVVYLFFKNQIHVWMMENILSRFGMGNKLSPPTTTADRVEFQPMI